MNFFKLHIGDYVKSTPQLSMLEHGNYFKLMCLYYDRESPIPDVDKYRLIGARRRTEKSACDRVLLEFFTKDGDVWRNKRCDEEIAAYQSQAAINRKNAASRKQRIANESLANRIPNRLPNHKPESISQNPDVVLSNNSACADASTCPAENPGARALLEKQQVNFDAGWLGLWQVYGLERLEKAIAIARDRLKGQELRPSYLDRVLRDEKNFNGVLHVKPWFIHSSTAIEAKAAELGISPAHDESFPVFKARVFQAAGVTAEMIHAAESEWR